MCDAIRSCTPIQHTGDSKLIRLCLRVNDMLTPVCKTTDCDKKGKKPKLVIEPTHVDNDAGNISKEFEQAANEMFVDYKTKFVNLQRRPLSKLVTQLPASEKEKRKELQKLTKSIEKHLHVFNNRLNVTAVQASYKIEKLTQLAIPCVTVYVLGKGRIPLGETDIKKIDKLASMSANQEHKK